jgi:hypothetical protein
MEKPKELSGEQGKYIRHLESILLKYQSKTTNVNTYFGIKTIVDDLNFIMINGIEIPKEIIDEDGNKKIENVRVPVISSDSLSSKEDKILDRLFKFIGESGKYNAQLKEMEEEFAPEIKKVDENYGSELEEVIFTTDK